jgi:hypothetical protein
MVADGSFLYRFNAAWESGGSLFGSTDGAANCGKLRRIATRTAIRRARLPG